MDYNSRQPSTSHQPAPKNRRGQTSSVYPPGGRTEQQRLLQLNKFRDNDTKDGRAVGERKYLNRGTIVGEI